MRLLDSDWVLSKSPRYAIRLFSEEVPEKTYVAKWKAVEVFAKDSDGSPLYGDDGSISNPDVAPVFAKGFVKWDGCLDMRFMDDCMLHFCGRGNAVNNMTELFDCIYQLVIKHMPNHDPDLLT